MLYIVLTLICVIYFSNLSVKSIQLISTYYMYISDVNGALNFGLGQSNPGMGGDRMGKSGASGIGMTSFPGMNSPRTRSAPGSNLAKMALFSRMINKMPKNLKKMIEMQTIQRLSTPSTASRKSTSGRGQNQQNQMMKMMVASMLCEFDTEQPVALLAMGGCNLSPLVCMEQSTEMYNIPNALTCRRDLGLCCFRNIQQKMMITSLANA